ncbi:oxidoreductase C-terminal domain-containing protein [Streptomyces phyllanthi]|uniref:Reductase C-terminal domain-containing protein n=1 Tax=Streptomyces phyllanthi TaxID=1803180 RepID=A0A5N8VVB9_9ACTN|nr:hypothetical protein [Streptomyces phyllanthi]
MPHAEHWEAAQHDGARAAAPLLGAQPPPLTWFWSDRHSRHVEAVGHLSEATETVVRSRQNPGRPDRHGRVRRRGAPPSAAPAPDGPNDTCPSNTGGTMMSTWCPCATVRLPLCARPTRWRRRYR